MSECYSVPPAGGFASINKYNPHLWGAEQLRSIFVVRHQELNDLTNSLRNTVSGQVGQHVLLVGARGMGKSTLMQRLALAVEDDTDLSAKWLALRFPEEQYTVNTLGQFWSNVLDAMIDTLDRQGMAIQALDQEAQRIASQPVADQAQSYLDMIHRCAQKRQQRFLLLVDNTDLLLHNIGQQAHWDLRAVLQRSPYLLWVGGSYQSLEANSQYHDAFLDFFRVIELCPLQLPEMKEALLALARTFGSEHEQAALKQQLQQRPERLAVLRQLSGGNPRTTVMLYSLLSSTQGGNVRGDLETLLDEMTPLYKSRLDNLADLPRKLLAHILEHWAPLALGDLARLSQEKNTSVSPQLQRLELEGLVEKVKLHGRRRNGYQVAERLFNIWYLMRLSPRRQRARLLWLVEFMRLWFSGDELRAIASSRLRAKQQYSAIRPRHELEYDHALAIALSEENNEHHALYWSLLKQKLHMQREQLADVLDLQGADQEFQDAADYLQRLNRLPDLLRQNPHLKSEKTRTQWVEWVMASLSLSLGEKERVAQAAPGLSQLQYGALCKLFQEERQSWKELLGSKVATALHVAVWNKDFFPDTPNAQLAYEQMRNCFAQHAQAARFVCARMYDQHKNSWTLQALDWLQTQFPKQFANAVWMHHDKARLLHYHLGRYEDAEVAYNHAIKLDKKLVPPLYNLGNLLKTHLGRYKDAEDAYRKAIALDKKDAWPWNGLGNLLQDYLGHYEEAEAAYRQAIALDEKLAYPWNSLGNLLQSHLGRYKDAEAAYRQAIMLDKNKPWPYTNLARLLWRQKRFAEAKNLYKDVLVLAKEEHVLKLQAHLALGNRQLVLDALHALSQQAQQGDTLAFYRLKEQVWECSELDLGELLADWMAESEYALFLQPFIQALYTLAPAKDKLRDLPQETQRIADDVVNQGLQRQGQRQVI